MRYSSHKLSRSEMNNSRTFISFHTVQGSPKIAKAASALPQKKFLLKPLSNRTTFYLMFATFWLKRSIQSFYSLKVISLLVDRMKKRNLDITKFGSKYPSEDLY